MTYSAFKKGIFSLPLTSFKNQINHFHQDFMENIKLRTEILNLKLKLYQKTYHKTYHLKLYQNGQAHLRFLGGLEMKFKVTL